MTVENDLENAPVVSVEVGARIEGRYVFDDDNIRSYALAAVDHNPLHHDADVAAQSQFGCLIACAAQSTGVYTSLLATYFAPAGQALGLEFNFKLRRAVRTGTDAAMIWVIVAREHSEKLGGDLVDIEGTMTDQDGRVLIEGRGRLLYLGN